MPFDALMSFEQNSGAQDEKAIAVIVLCIDAEARDAIAYWLKFLTDRLLPPWPGLGRIHTLLVKQPSLRVAFVDNGAPDGLWRAHAFGATDFLPWPLTRRSLLDLLVRVEAVPRAIYG